MSLGVTVNWKLIKCVFTKRIPRHVACESHSTVTTVAVFSAVLMPSTVLSNANYLALLSPCGERQSFIPVTAHVTSWHAQPLSGVWIMESNRCECEMCVCLSVRASACKQTWIFVLTSQRLCMCSFVAICVCVLRVCVFPVVYGSLASFTGPVDDQTEEKNGQISFSGLNWGLNTTEYNLKLFKQAERSYLLFLVISVHWHGVFVPHFPEITWQSNSVYMVLWCVFPWNFT